MASVLHITNGDSAGGLIQKSGIGGDVLPRRDVLHEGPVPADLDLDQLREVRAGFIGSAGLGDLETIRREFLQRDDTLRRFADYDEVVLWFEWDLYDQLQLIQLLVFFAGFAPEGMTDTGTSISLVAGYIQRMSDCETPFIMYPSGHRIDAPRTEEDSRAFKHADMAVTDAGRQVRCCGRDWITLGGSDRRLGGVHFAGSAAIWRWDSDARALRQISTDQKQ